MVASNCLRYINTKIKSDSIAIVSLNITDNAWLIFHLSIMHSVLKSLKDLIKNWQNLKLFQRKLSWNVQIIWRQIQIVRPYSTSAWWIHLPKSANDAKIFVDKVVKTALAVSGCITLLTLNGIHIHAVTLQNYRITHMKTKLI